MGGEACHQRGLFIGELADLLPENSEPTNDIAFLQHGDAEPSAYAAKFDAGSHRRVAAVSVGLLS